jgi:RNA polymerase sigma-32 factor
LSNILALSIDSTFNDYIRKITNIPILQQDEEELLINRWFNHKDVSAAQKLIEAYLRLVVKVTVKFKNYGLPIMDLISEGNIGLMKAIKNFNPEIGCKIATYAIWWIKAAIHEYVLKSWSIVKIGTTAAQRKLFFNLRKLKNSIVNANSDIKEDAIITQISEKLDIKEKDVKEMNCLLSARDASINNPIDDNSETEMYEMIESPEINQESQLMLYQENTLKRKLLKDAISSLDDRDKKIFLLRSSIKNPKTLKEVSIIFNISQERVRQIHSRVLQKIKDYIKINSIKVGII